MYNLDVCSVNSYFLIANGYKNDRKDKGASGAQNYIMAAQDMAEAHSKPSEADPDIMFNKSRFTSALNNFCAQWALYLKSHEGVDVSAGDLKALYKAGKLQVKFSYFEPARRVASGTKYNSYHNTYTYY